MSTVFTVNVQVGFGSKLLVTFGAGKLLIGMDLDIMLFEQLERFEIFVLEGFSNVVLALDHGTVEGRLDVTSIGLLEGDVMSHQYM